MIMQGTAVNAAAIALGSLLGLKGGHLLSSRVRDTVMAGLGLVTPPPIRLPITIIGWRQECASWTPSGSTC